MSLDWSNFRLDVPSTKDYEISGRVMNETEGKKEKTEKKIGRNVVPFETVAPLAFRRLLNT